MSAVPALLRPILLLALLALLSVGGMKYRTKVNAAQNVTVPPPPAQRADRFGIYNWNVNDSAFPTDGSTDRLNWGADKVVQMGSRTIRVAISSRDDYGVNPPDGPGGGLAGNPNLVEIAQSAAYDKLFRDARFQTYLLTAYPRGAIAGDWSDGYTQAEYDTERDEIRRLGEYLLGNAAFAGKTFILLNWEGDNAMYYFANKQTIWDSYTNWIRARVEGVKLARQNVPSSNVRIYSGLEFNVVRSPLTGRPCGEAVTDAVSADPLRNRCLIDYVAPQVEADYYSYSSWQSLTEKEINPAANLKQIYKRDLDFALAKIKARRPEITEANFIIGEFGFERSRYGECYAANALNEMFEAFDGADAFHVSYAIFWQVMDNGHLYGLLDERFGLFRVKDQTVGATMLSECFQKRIAGQTIASYAGCPRIRKPPEAPGVLNQQGTPEFKLNPDTISSIYVPNCCQTTTAPFSATGNTVHFNQNAQQLQAPRDNAAAFYESTTQINFSMPTARRPGETWVYVTDARGYESNAQSIRVECPDCPAINSSCGVLDTAWQTLRIEPGMSITITGSKFGASGNSVIIEQLEARQATRRWTLGRENITSESTSQIIVRLPDDLLTGQDALIHVASPQGLESSESIVSISAPCASCGPRLKPCVGFVNESGGEFVAGTIVSVFGRFTPIGNKIVIEQFDQNGVLYRQTVTQDASTWEENNKRIKFPLPATLFPGRALMYIADVQGRESRAQAITISPTPVWSASAASYRGPAIAAESIVASFGTALAKTTEVANTTPLPNDLSGTKVLIKDSAGVERMAPLFFVSPAQINYQLPLGTAFGPATITFKNPYGSASFGSIEVVRIAPALFSANATGKGAPAAVALRIKANGEQTYEHVVTYDPGQKQFVPIAIDLGPATDQVFLILYANGVRGRSALSAVSANIGGVNAPVSFAGPQGALVGLDQVNLLLPRSLGGRGEVDAFVTEEDKATNTVRVKIK